jgi:putative ABC transport system permease protein
MLATSSVDTTSRFIVIPALAASSVTIRWMTLSRRFSSDSFVERSWPGQDPIGKRFHVAGDPDGLWTTVVGVVGSVEENPIETRSRPSFYRPIDQVASRGAYFVVRTAGEPMALASAAREALWAVDPNLPIASVDSLHGAREERFAGLRTGAAMMGAFAVMAALLAVVGIYGVMSFRVSQRTHELGVRLALGAGSADLMRLVLGHGARITGIGIVVGLAGAIALTRLLGSLLYEVSATDPFTFAGAALVLGATALLACYLPARRAGRVDPVIALRGN